MNIGIEQIKNLLSNTGMSQTELAEKSGLAFATLNRILNGKQPLLPNTAKKIADALDLSMIDLMDESASIPQENNSIVGYLEYNGEITKIKSLRQLEKWIADIKEENEIPIKAKKIIAENERNRKAILKALPNRDYHFNIEDFETMEEYDATQLECWGWKTGYDAKNGIRLDLGNQCSGYEFDYNGNHFYTNESFYLCGQFSQAPTDELTGIQYQLLYEKNGFTAKKKIKNANRSLIRTDWNEIAPHWMMFVCWMKCKANKEFANLLKSLPVDAILMENSTTIKEGTSSSWGVKNQELEDARDIVGRYAEMQYFKNIKKNGGRANRTDADKAILDARNAIHYIGVYKGGKNYMGKILKRCQLALINGTEPEIDYNLLKSKRIYLFGKLLTFDD